MQNRIYNVSSFVERQKQIHLQNVCKNIRLCLERQTQGASNPGSWGRQLSAVEHSGEKGILSTLYYFISIEFLQCECIVYSTNIINFNIAIYTITNIFIEDDHSEARVLKNYKSFAPSTAHCLFSFPRRESSLR